MSSSSSCRRSNRSNVTAITRNCDLRRSGRDLEKLRIANILRSEFDSVYQIRCSPSSKRFAGVPNGNARGLPGQSPAAHLLPHDLMMMGTQSGSQITAQPAPSDGPCCRMSTAPPLFIISSAPTKQHRELGRIQQLELSGMLVSLAALGRTAFAGAAPPLSSSSHQALLCTFLI
jgi:hypothetical protein